MLEVTLDSTMTTKIILSPANHLRLKIRPVRCVSPSLRRFYRKYLGESDISLNSSYRQRT